MHARADPWIHFTRFCSFPPVLIHLGADPVSSHLGTDPEPFIAVGSQVTGLPQGPFSTYEERPGGKLITRWVWRYESEVPSDMLASS